jgi:hypothetical protein
VGHVVGSDGATGVTGVTGNGIASLSISNDGTLQVTYTDSTNQVVGNVMGPTGTNGADGATGNTGPPGQSSSYFSYRADNDVLPTTGHISWSNFVSQVSSTDIRVNHINQSGVDVDIFLNLIEQGSKLIIQDANVSANFQQWLVSGIPIPNTGSNYVEYPITLISSGGSANFANNHEIILASVVSGFQGPTLTTGSWTLPPGANTVNLTVPLNDTYSIWVRGNIPNGIIAYTATVVVSNNNVPVVGSHYGWYYADGGALVLTSIPSQIVGTPNTISSAIVNTITSNVFEFGITNNTLTYQVVNWGYTTF